MGFSAIHIYDALRPIFVFIQFPPFNQDVENDGPEPSDWDRFAAEEYEALVTEESAQVQLQEG